ncbi:MAG: helix-turn-helix domain-containing protein [Phocaeicola sp.]
MSFAENLKAIRKEKNISQEDLAEMLNVSRQAVSKWEQGIGFPEMEKMLTLSKQLNVSLDYLTGNENFADKPQKHDTPVSGKIMIRAQDGKSVVHCYKVVSYPVAKSNGVPKYVLFGIDRASFLDENRNLLGWYADEDMITKEIDAILAALESGEPTYKLKYCAKVKKTFFSVKLDE